MPELNGLSIAFAVGHPAHAARVLETLEPDSAAEFLAALAPGEAAAVLRNMAAAPCARILGELEEERMLLLFERLNPQQAARLLQQHPAEEQARLLERLPLATAMVLRMLMGYPEGSCGASMHPEPPAFAPEAAVGRVLEELRRAREAPADGVFVVNGRRRLTGVATLEDLVRAGPRDALGSIMRAPQHALSAYARIATVAAHAGWEEFHVLPVVESEQRLVGALDRRVLLTALRGAAGRAGADLGGLAGAYWETLTVLTQLVVRALPPVKAVSDARRNDGG